MSVNGAFLIVSMMAWDYRRYLEIGKSFVTAGVWGPSRYPAGGVVAEPPLSCSFFSVAVFLPEGHNVPRVSRTPNYEF